MSLNFDLSKYKTLDELYMRASFEQTSDDVLFVRKFGRANDIDANETADIWSTGGTKTTFTAAEKINIVSDDANDDFGSTGATTILVGGLDADYNLQQEVVVMNGTSSVQTLLDYREVNRVRVIGAGSSMFNEGTITLTGADTAAVHASIPAEGSITQQSHFTVPAGYTCFTVGIALTAYRSGSGTGTRRTEVDQMVYVPSVGTRYSTLRYAVANDSPYVVRNQMLSQTPEKTTLWFRATAEANNTEVTSSASYLLVKGDYNNRTEI